MTKVGRGGGGGYTLIEIVLVLVILSIVAGMAASGLGGSAGAATVMEARDQLMSDLRAARSRAMVCGFEDGAREVDVVLTGGGWEVDGEDSQVKQPRV
ncbi:type II secretion system protein [Halorhodospira sp. 9622]|uniref:pilus assembly FimT family protein n=1 Tax=Halorhodospira sp. 9622 TaxID=2899136 RepID=UPI001EE8105C|nr:type II secretion system GspH family protein [Halorhodospira sp. 9622]